MRISDWSSDVCSSDLHYAHALSPPVLRPQLPEARSKQPSQSRRHFRASTPLQTALRDREPSIGRGQCPSLQLLSNKMAPRPALAAPRQIGRAHVCTTVTNDNPVCSLQLETTHIC